MFIKPFKVKSNSQVKGSEVKKLKTRLAQQFKHLDESDLSSLLPLKSKVVTIQIVTHSDEPVIVWTVDKRPMIFELSERLFPTVYSLWMVPNFLPLFTSKYKLKYCIINIYEISKSLPSSPVSFAKTSKWSELNASGISKNRV